MKKDCFPMVSESPRTLKKRRIEKEEQKYAASFIEESKDKSFSYFANKKSKDEGSLKERQSYSNHIGSNEDLNSSLKKEIDQSNISSPRISSSSISPIKPETRVEVSRRVDSNDSGHRSSHNQNHSSIRAHPQYRKASNDPNDRVRLNEKLAQKKTLAHKCRKDSQETYQPNGEVTRLSHNDWNSKLSNGPFSPSKPGVNLDQSDYNHFNMIANNTATSALNQTQNVKLSDYLVILNESKTPKGSKKMQVKGNKNIQGAWFLFLCKI